MFMDTFQISGIRQPVRRVLTTLSLIVVSGCVYAQTLSIGQCVDYALGHNHDLRLSRLQVESSRVEHTRSLAAFLPAVSASCGIQYNYGRSVSSETNTYENVSTFANSWAAQMSMPLFDGGYLLAGYRRSRLALAQSTEALEQARQELALQVVQQYIDVVYYDCLSGIMQQKLSDTDTLLNISRVKAELGLLSESELVQIQAQRATDDYNLAHVRSQCRQSLIALFTSMNYMPVEADTAVLSSFTLEFPTYDSCRLDRLFPQWGNKSVCLAQLELRQSDCKLRQAWSSIMPSVGLFAGVSTSFYKRLHAPAYSSYGSQLDHNLGRYWGISVQMPIFNRLQVLSSIRQARIVRQMDAERLESATDEAACASLSIRLDVESLSTEQTMMQLRVEADSVAYHAQMLRYGEGLATQLEVSNAASTLLESRVGRLRTRLTLLAKRLLLSFYTH